MQMQIVEKQFISLAKDTVFKYLFKSKYFRKWFEEIILDQTGINLLGYELIDGEHNTGSKNKDYRLDLLLEKGKELVVIEMNTSNSPSNLFKNYSYLFRIAGNRYDKQEKTYESKITRLIIINSYRSIEAPGIPILYFALQDKENSIKRDMIESYEIYLPKKGKREYNKIEKRLLLFEAKSFEEMRKITQDSFDLEIIEELERLSMDDYFRYMYNEKEVNERLMNSRYQEGIDIGKDIGEKNGSQLEKEKIAKKLLDRKMNLQEISQVTGLSIEKITTMKQELGKN